MIVLTCTVLKKSDQIKRLGFRPRVKTEKKKNILFLMFQLDIHLCTRIMYGFNFSLVLSNKYKLSRYEVSWYNWGTFDIINIIKNTKCYLTLYSVYIKTSLFDCWAFTWIFVQKQINSITKYKSESITCSWNVRDYSPKLLDGLAIGIVVYKKG